MNSRPKIYQFVNFGPAVNRYTLLEVKDRFALMNAAFGQEPYKVNDELEIIG